MEMEEKTEEEEEEKEEKEQQLRSCKRNTSRSDQTGK